MIGREKREYNDLFFVCSLIEYIGRKTKNHRAIVVNSVGQEKWLHIYELADVYHSDNIDRVSDELIDKYKITTGNFDNIADCQYSIPTHWDIGKVYKRLIISICKKQGKEVIPILMDTYNSYLSEKIEDFNCSLYYESPNYLYESYLAGKPL
jgi:hypothetical protein